MFLFLQWNLSKSSLLGSNLCVQNRQVKLTKFSYIGTLFKVWFIQDFNFHRVWFYTEFGLDRSHCMIIFVFLQLHNKCAPQVKPECDLGEYREHTLPPTCVCPAVLVSIKGSNSSYGIMVCVDVVLCRFTKLWRDFFFFFSFFKNRFLLLKNCLNCRLLFTSPYPMWLCEVLS